MHTPFRLPVEPDHLLMVYLSTHKGSVVLFANEHGSVLLGGAPSEFLFKPLSTVRRLHIEDDVAHGGRVVDLDQGVLASAMAAIKQGWGRTAFAFPVAALSGAPTGYDDLDRLLRSEPSLCHLLLSQLVTPALSSLESGDMDTVGPCEKSSPCFRANRRFRT